MKSAEVFHPCGRIWDQGAALDAKGSLDTGSGGYAGA